eukprot:TRINITY_DN6091_c0_g1_i1.p1 TRINITY_DN6091_c0_g1~~TRINITY_DN6091_c0_g1_i1.p1  ORF type:complete len:142 (+),score=26.19 TRINITY_DN6091_c0_g1_i1:76-501(+)
MPLHAVNLSSSMDVISSLPRSEIVTSSCGPETHTKQAEEKAADIVLSSKLDLTATEQNATTTSDQKDVRSESDEWRERLCCGDVILVYSEGFQAWQESVITTIGLSTITVMSVLGVKARIKTVSKWSDDLRVPVSNVLPRA